ncbi:MAG: sensor N-terminal transmembrane domain-containing protein, partial [Magnetospirillum sp. WYHS-4]
MAETSRQRRRARRRGISPITRRILAVNMLAPALLVVGLFYFDEYRDNLIAAELSALETQAEIIAGALGETSISVQPSGDVRLEDESAQDLIRRTVEPTGGRTRLFGPDGNLLADSRIIGPFQRRVQVEPLPPPPGSQTLWARVGSLFRQGVEALSPGKPLEPYREPAQQTAYDYGEAWEVLRGLEPMSSMLRRR